MLTGRLQPSLFTRWQGSGESACRARGLLLGRVATGTSAAPDREADASRHRLPIRPSGQAILSPRWQDARAPAPTNRAAFVWWTLGPAGNCGTRWHQRGNADRLSFSRDGRVAATRGRRHHSPVGDTIWPVHSFRSAGRHYCSASLAFFPGWAAFCSLPRIDHRVHDKRYHIGIHNARSGRFLRHCGNFPYTAYSSLLGFSADSRLMAYCDGNTALAVGTSRRTGRSIT